MWDAAADGQADGRVSLALSALETFTLVTGIASLVGLAIQLFDLFPRFSRYRAELLLFITGLFLGSLISSIMGSRIALTAELTPMQLLIAVVTAVTAFLVLSARFQRNPNHRQETYAISLGGVFLLIALIFFYGLASAGPMANSDRLDVYNLGVDEFVLLSSAAERRGDFDRAIELTNFAINSLEDGDPRYAPLAARKEKLQKRQIQ